MSETHTNGLNSESLLGDHETAVMFSFTMLLAGLAVGWAGRSLLAGEALTEQFWLVPVVVGLATSVYAQAKGI